MKDSPFRSDLLIKNSKIGRYTLYLDGSTGWGIAFPNGHIEVEEGPKGGSGFTNGTINGIEFSTEPVSFPMEYLEGKTEHKELERFFDIVVKKYSNLTDKF